MKVKGEDYRTVWLNGSSVCMINQCLLPYHFEIHNALSYSDTCRAIRDMIVRGAGAIGAAAGFAMAQACKEAPLSIYLDFISQARKEIESTRPTARDLFFAVEKVYDAGLISPEEAVRIAQQIADKNASDGKRIGEIGQSLIMDGYRIQTHCNAGWLGLVDFGSALSPVYIAHLSGKKVFVYVDETRPRNQGARLTAWELQQANIPFAIIADNAGPYLMSKGEIDMVIVGADRIAANGDVANKIGTLGKALAAKEFHIPFYVAAPTSTFDVNCPSGAAFIIEERDQKEVLFMQGYHPESNQVMELLVSAPGSQARNPAFDITPARYISGIITEKALIPPTQESIHQIVES